MKKPAIGDACIKIKQINYEDEAPQKKISRSSSMPRNPIKVVVDMMGEDGFVYQKIINQNEKVNQTKSVTQFRINKAKSEKVQFYPIERKTYRSMQPQGLARSFVFNRFSYDNYRDFPIPKTLRTRPSKKTAGNLNHKNIEVVFCQTKLPDFVQKTNQEIEEIYKQEQLHQHNLVEKHIKHSMNLQKNWEIGPPRRAPRTTLANCLKEYATLEKLSIFMENDQQRRENCLCYEMEKDHSRNLLLDIITHRFKFFKTMSKRIREEIYRIMLGRQVNSLTKINVQEYMKISEMFVGRDANNNEIGVFMYIFLFGERVPTFEVAQEKLSLINGHVYRLKMLLEQLNNIMRNYTSDYLVETFCTKGKLLRLFIDYLVQRE